MKVIVDNKIPFIRDALERLADEVIYKPGAEICREDVRDADALIRAHPHKLIMRNCWKAAKYLSSPPPP